MTETYHYDAKYRAFPRHEAQIYTYDASYPHVLLGMRCRVANSTGKERDTETGNDDFGARYYSNRLGRWLSSDWSAAPVAVPYANLTNPQTLNLYSMVADDPESFADLDGHLSIDAPSSFPGIGNFGGQGCPPGAILCEDEKKKDPPPTSQDPGIVQKAEKALDYFNEYLGFEKTNCSKGGDCVNALGMALTARAVAVASDGASEEAFIERQIGTAERKIENIAEKALTKETLEAASREAGGGMKVAKAGGGVFEHVPKVQDAIRGLNRQINHLERVLGRSGLSDSQVTKINGIIEKARGFGVTALKAITPKEPL